MNARRGCDHAIFEQVIRLVSHQSRPFTKAKRIHGEHLGGCFQAVYPPFDLVCFCGITIANYLYPVLQFGESHRRDQNLIRPQTGYPSRNGGMRLGLARLRDDVRIQKVSFHSNCTGGRLRKCRRELGRSNRGPSPSRTSLMSGLVDLCSRRHSSIGTSTAASMPRFVTTWGPFFKVVSSNSLNRAFAS